MFEFLGADGGRGCPSFVRGPARPQGKLDNSADPLRRIGLRPYCKVASRSLPYLLLSVLLSCSRPVSALGQKTDFRNFIYNGMLVFFLNFPIKQRSSISATSCPSDFPAYPPLGFIWPAPSAFSLSLKRRAGRFVRRSTGICTSGRRWR